MAMTALALPDVRLHRSWAETVADFGDSVAMHGSGVWHLPEEHRLDVTEEGCRRLVATLREYADPAATLPDGMVHSDYFWITDGEPGSADGEVVGFLALRHRLNDFLLETGGHIGYSVRPTRRREGHATRALGLVLERARELGLDRVLLTCDDDNVASAATIVANGGVLEDVRDHKNRYWVGS